MTFELGFAVAWGVIVAGAGGGLTVLTPWYRALRKPSWQPPDWLFGPAWTVILGLASWSCYLVLEAGAITLAVVLFVVNGVANIAWSPLFFILRRPDWALIEVPFLWLSILVAMVLVWPVSALAGWLLVPYLVWVSFASFLNLTVVRLNAPFTGRRRMPV